MGQEFGTISVYGRYDHLYLNHYTLRFYSAYIENQYDIIQEQVAKGHGSHLDALAHFTGCREQALRPFRRTLNTHYEELFGMQKNPEMVREKIAGLIELTPALRILCASG